MAERPKIWIDLEGRLYTGERGITPITKDELLRLIHPRLDGPPRNIVIHPPLPWRQIVVCAVVVALIAIWLAVGHS